MITFYERDSDPGPRPIYRANYDIPWDDGGSVKVVARFDNSLAPPLLIYNEIAVYQLAQIMPLEVPRFFQDRNGRLFESATEKRVM